MSFSQKTLESMSQAVWYNRWTLNKFKRYLRGEILEVGCGIGNFTKSLKEYGDVYAIDIDNNYISEVKKLISEKVGFGDIEKGEYFFTKKDFDCIVCLNVLEHVKDDKKALQNLARLLKGEGYLILLVPAHKFLYGKIDESLRHYRRYDKTQIEKVVKSASFNILKIRRINFLGAIGWFVTGRLLGEQNVDEDKIKIFNFLATLVLPIEDLIEPPFGTSILVIAQKFKS